MTCGPSSCRILIGPNTVNAYGIRVPFRPGSSKPIADQSPSQAGMPSLSHATPPAQHTRRLTTNRIPKASIPADPSLMSHCHCLLRHAHASPRATSGHFRRGLKVPRASPSGSAGTRVSRARSLEAQLRWQPRIASTNPASAAAVLHDTQSTKQTASRHLGLHVERAVIRRRASHAKRMTHFGDSCFPYPGDCHSKSAYCRAYA